MRRVLYFSGYRMIVFEWEKRRLLGQFTFEPTDTGLEEFSEYLNLAPRMPVQFLVDIIEEDFRRETIPHVSARDRQALINRLLDRHYRDEKYVHVQRVGRLKDGRKDDQILLSALTSRDIFAPWLKVIDTLKVPFSGVWSAPILIGKLLKYLPTDKEKNVLIASRQIRTAIRETFFQNGHMLFSRQAKIDRDHRDNDSTQTTVDNLKSSTDQIHHFLTNQRIIGFNDHLVSICLIQDDQVEEANRIHQDTAAIHYKFTGIESLFKSAKIQFQKGYGVDTLCAYLCSEESLLTDHYAPKQDKENFHIYMAERIASKAAAIGTIIFLTASAFLWLHSQEINQEKIAVDNNRNLLQRRYTDQYSAIERQLEDAFTIQSIVEQAKQLQTESKQTPQSTFIALSQVFSQIQFYPLSIQRMEWTKHRLADISRVVREHVRVTPPNWDAFAEEEYIEEGAVNTTLLQPVVRLIGELDPRGLSYRDTVNTMRSFISSLENLSEVEEIHVINTPVDIRSYSQFADQNGTEMESELIAENKNRYEILLVLGPLPHENPIQ